ncbi:NADPH-dependent F420 reductase [Candidatus Lucifugimonas marina]|jgi:predicted dinucleotide-binding enzyme|uniref:Dinucleotide-binding enzyme n=1 Tax=Candidatus Lucifugimonas marina TaxID=3038979 RepID=A0AAJ6CTL1_9CHLR|nr:dinucleotide-binding enzyme [SAR202 cluster bacterium JH702]MDG0870794.1 dinucleotide-binding enzyme [SAR202 cluster bacterium JH639]WFG36485.1 dinucleotide-binding enzyme [SAR202 cluster bacterium JH545]WFG40418.1 dinucleotide-binding enzyme [SAR202 cluster bacterium JH1073]
MRIAVIGSGSVGAGLARSWSGLGHSVVIGSRSPESERVIELVDLIGNGVSAAGLAESAVGADVIVLAVPWSAAEVSLASLGDLSGRILVDATNPFAGGLNLEIGHDDSGGEQVARWASGANVVKALNIVDARLLDGRNLDDREISIPICGDDRDAKRVVGGLIGELGFDVIDAGKLEISRLLEPLCLLMIKMSMKKSLGNEIGFRVLRD